jgi:lipoic acid synthetase
MGLSYCVITSVDRDDLPDQGAAHWRDTVNAIRRVNPDTTIEVLIPISTGGATLLIFFWSQTPTLLGITLKTIERLTPQVRTKAKYRKSLETLRYIAGKGFATKSGIMLGLGETFDEVVQTLDDLAAVGCRMVTIGQYLQPRPNNLPVQRYVRPGSLRSTAE